MERRGFCFVDVVLREVSGLMMWELSSVGIKAFKKSLLDGTS